jgi:hypothetical protein
MLDDLKELVNAGFEDYGEKHNWTHKSYLWEFPYVNALILPHNIDFMHQESNIVEGIISMCFDVTCFSKENISTRKDLAALCNCPSLEAKRPRAPCCLKPAERKEILRWLKKLKFSDRYAS